MIVFYLLYLGLMVGVTWVIRLLSVTTPPFAVAQPFVDFFSGLGVQLALVSNAIGVDVSTPLSLMSGAMYIMFTILVLRVATFSPQRAVLLGTLFGLVSVFF